MRRTARRPKGNPYRYKASGRYRKKPSNGQARDKTGRFAKSVRRG